MTPEKSLTRVEAVHAETKQPIEAYEIHIGRTEGADRARPFARVDGAAGRRDLGDGRVQGSYLHGLFTSDDFRTRVSRAAWRFRWRMKAIAPGSRARSMRWPITSKNISMSKACSR